MSEDKIEKGEQTPVLNEKIYNQHNWLVVTLILVAFALFVCVIGFNALLFTPFYDSDIFNKTSELLDIMPATWNCSIWVLIYAVQLIWLVYGLVSLFRKTTNGSYLYLKPDYMFFGIYIAIIVNYLANIGWCFTQFRPCCVLFFDVVMAFSLYVFLFISCKKLFENQSELDQLGLAKDIWFVRVFVQNGCAIYATWTSLMTIFSFGKFLVHYADVQSTNASTYTLVLVLLATVNYFAFENFVWHMYLRYMYTPYIVIVWTLIGCFSKSLKNTGGQFTRNNTFTLCMLIIIVLIIIGRVIFNFFYRTKHQEGFYDKLMKVNKIFKSSRSGSEQEHEPSEQP
jgi:hypothetical protein